MSNPTEKSIAELKEAVKDLAKEEEILRDDLYLLQWLKSRKMSVKTAEASIRASMKWRTEKDVKSIKKQDFPQPLIDGSPMFWEFESITGEPANYTREDDVGLTGYLKLYGYDTLVRFFTFQYLEMEAIVNEHNRKRNQKTKEITMESTVAFTTVFDSEGYGFRNAASLKVLQLYFEIAKIYANYFPALAQTGIFINANKFTQIAMKIIKPWLEGPATTLKVYGTDPSTWEPEVHATIDPEKFKWLRQRVISRNERFKVGPLQA